MEALVVESERDEVVGESPPPPRKALKKRAGRTVARRPRYGNPEIERALIAVAYTNGNTHQAARDLAEDGLNIDHKTLWRWSRRLHVDRYEELRAEVLPRIRAHAAERHMALADAQMDVSRRMTERLAEEIEDVPARDLPGGIRNVTTAAAVHTDKAQLLNDQPTQIVKREASEVLRALKARGIIIDGGEVLDAEVVEDDE